MEAAKKLSLTALTISLLPLAALIPVFLKITLPDGVRTIWAVCNVVLVLTGFLPSLICVKNEKSRCIVSILSTIISAALLLIMLGITAFALVLNYLR